jgi:hypothetical protein
MASASDALLLHGGKFEFSQYNVVTFNDTWIWKDASWRRARIDSRAPARLKHTISFLPRFGKYLLFGGFGPPADVTRDDTWLFDLASEVWDRANTPVAPTERSYHAAVTDTLRDRIVLFGGESGTLVLSDTWIAR